MVHVPRMLELSVKTLIETAARDKELKMYLPMLIKDDGVKNINRQYLFNIINTVKPEFFPENIRAIISKKREMKALKEKQYIDINPDMWQLINNTYVKSNGKYE